ncbi:MAG: FG-GAP-like repeat-containing protein [Terriglobales bacterium]
MPSRLLQLCCVCSLVIFLTQLVVAQSNPVARANQTNTVVNAGELRGTVTGEPVVRASARLSANPFHANRMVDPAPMDSGAFLFLPAVTYPAGQNADAVAVADFNGDGHPDLAVANGCLSSTICYVSGVSILLGNGDGTFQTPVTYSTGGVQATSIAVADLNGDGHPDIVVVNQCQSSPGGCANGGLSVLLGNGDGTFQTPVTYSSGGSTTDSVVIGDVNGDGHLDLAVANFEGGVGVLLGNGDGTFQAPVSYNGGYDPNSVAIGDVNGDGHLDLVVADLCQDSGCANGAVSVLLGNGDGTFQAPVTYSSGGIFSYSTAIGDVNGDGHPDLVVSNIYCGADCFNSAVGVLIGNGDGTFQAPITYNAGGGVTALVITDVNGDGHRDLLMTNAALACNGICGGVAELMLGVGDGTFPTVATYSSGGFTSDGFEENGNMPTAIALADVNDDGSPDLLVVNQCGSASWTCANGGTIGVLLNNSAAPTTTTSLVSNVNPVDLKKVVTYTATVASQSGGAVNGAVTFTDSFSSVPTVVTLANNQASYSTSYPKGDTGAHTITATYPGVLHQAMGSQSAITEYVRTAITTTVLTTSGSPSFAGQPVTFTATVTSKSGAIPDGELVTFNNGSVVLASVALTGGQARYTTASLTTATHVIKASYGGDNTFEPSSATVTQRVELYPTTTALASSPNPSNFGQAVTLTATVSSASPSGATGTVTFKNGTTTLGKATLSAGVATVTTTKLPVGTLTITANYSGDVQSAKSSGTTTQTVE